LTQAVRRAAIFIHFHLSRAVDRVLTLFLGNLFDTQTWNRRESTSGRSEAARVEAGKRRLAMQDVIMLLFTAAFFVLAFLYVKACQKLR
jgi:hypothetical protein